jgi:GST-like protein
MIDLYYAPTPNGQKIILFLEEAQLAYRLIRVDINKGEQFRPQFLALSPNNKIPAIVDHLPVDGGRRSACLSPVKSCSIWRKNRKTA